MDPLYEHENKIPLINFFDSCECVVGKCVCVTVHRHRFTTDSFFSSWGTAKKKLFKRKRKKKHIYYGCATHYHLKCDLVRFDDVWWSEEEKERNKKKLYFVQMLTLESSSNAKNKLLVLQMIIFT